MWAVRQDEHKIHFGTQVDEIAWPLPVRIPDEAAFPIDRDGCEKSSTWRDVSETEPNLGGGCKEILMRIA